MSLKLAPAPSGPSLTIVIPALNEEEAIGGTLQRCLDAQTEIKRKSGVEEVEIIVVNDGSTDRTVEIARSFPNVQVIDFKINRGYGAAIKEGFRQGHGSLVGFIDADGTCDPLVFSELCEKALTENADIVLGSRLGRNNKMPKTRRLGNRIFAFLLGGLSGRRVTDTASGMRVIRRASLKDLYPLPDGLHFTPAMSAKALINGLKIVEHPMPYDERIGESKLRIFADGIRFLRTIFAALLCYRPERFFLMGFAFCVAFGLFLMAFPSEFYIRNHRLEEWMIYRFLLSFLLGAIGLSLMAAAAISEKMAFFGPKRHEHSAFWASLAASCFEGSTLLTIIACSALVSVVSVWPGLTQFLTTGTISLHWSRCFVGALGILICSQASITGVLLKVVELWKSHANEPKP